jgi:hypothetical protein
MFSFSLIALAVPKKQLVRSYPDMHMSQYKLAHTLSQDQN